MNDILYIFIIDTNLYAGNFEREMCGYITARPLSFDGHTYPARESVAIFFKIRPTDGQIEFMKERAETFASRKAGLKILGYRLITRTTTVVDEMIRI